MADASSAAGAPSSAPAIDLEELAALEAACLLREQSSSSAPPAPGPSSEPAAGAPAPTVRAESAARDEAFENLTLTNILEGLGDSEGEAFWETRYDDAKYF